MPARARDPYADLAAAASRLTPGQLRAFAARLDPADLTVLEQALGQHLNTGHLADPATLAGHVDPGYRRYRYVDLLARRMVDAVTGGPRFTQINMPSQYGKTTFLQWAMAWRLARDPGRRLMYVSYDAPRAVTVGRAVRDMFERHPELGVTVRADLRSASQWRTTAGGGIYSVGVFGGITGNPADDLYLDDLFKGWQAAHSELQRDTVWDIYTSQIRLRLQDGGTVTAAGTRWHEDDHFARLRARAAVDVEADQWVNVVLPALAKAGDPLGRDVGEALEPDRFPMPEVLARAAALGSYLAASLEQQDPEPEEGGEIERGWWRWEDAPPARADVWVSSWDTKLKDREAGDYVVGQVWGRVGSSFHMVDQMRGQWSQAITRVALAAVAVRHPYVRTHYVEAAGWGPELREELTRGDPEYSLRPEIGDRLGLVGSERDAVEALVRRGVSNVVGHSPKGDKSVRLRAVSGSIEAGNVYLPTWVPGAPVLVDEAAAFPNGTHDDTLDAMSQALARLSGARSKFVDLSARTVPVRMH
jgi:phage terminase large subunit-like protein